MIPMICCVKHGGEKSGERLVGGNADPNITKACLHQFEIEYPKEDGSRNAVAALVADKPYTGLQRKRRRY